MRIALYINEGTEQIVLTPDTETETALLGRLTDGTRILTVKQGEFYHCMGGWMRLGGGSSSTILVLERDKGPKDTSNV